MSDTPRTDEARGMWVDGERYVKSALASKLERQNAELVAALRQIVQLDDDAHPGLMTWHDMRVAAHKKASELIKEAV